GDLYVNTATSALLEITACMLVAALFNNRSVPSQGSATICQAGVALCCLGAIVVDDGLLNNVFAWGAKLCGTITFGGIFMLSSEVLTTNNRSAALAVCLICGWLGTLAAPVVLMICSRLLAVHQMNGLVAAAAAAAGCMPKFRIYANTDWWHLFLQRVYAPSTYKHETRDANAARLTEHEEAQHLRLLASLSLEHEST
ncbi:hypothetical protein CYMTET_52487, partial [Cymbomonas tetramitiformis]